jgi:hypothetical protein
VGDVSVRFLYIGFNHRVKVIEHNYYTKKKKKIPIPRRSTQEVEEVFF